MNKGLGRLGSVGWIACALGGLGCGGSKSSTPEEVGSAVQALSPAATRTYGFESLQDWTPLWSSPTLSLSSTRSEGQSSLALGGGGWMQIQSQALSKEEQAPSVVGFDVSLPPSPVNPWWHGSAELFVDAPSVGIWGQFVGHAELTGLTPGQFRRVEFAVPLAIATRLDGNYTDLRIRIAINVPSEETAPYLVDHFTFGQGTPACTPQPDGNPCTDDVCLNGVPAWTPRPVGAACDTNATVCDGVGTCSASAACILGEPPVQDDGNPCTSDACDPANGPVHLPVSAGISCDSDGNVCNGVSRCNGAGVCAGGAAPSLDDGNPCTIDTCDAVAGVQHAPAAAGVSCDDGDPCNGEAKCDGTGVCTDGQAPDLNDSNPCTTDSCSASLGVQHLPVANGALCDDATVCNGRETCQNGVCAAGASPSLDDGNPCTADACDPVVGAIHEALADGTNCESDENICNGASACQAGVCANGSAAVVDDDNPCTADSCQPSTGVVHAAVADGTACDDGNPCTTNDSCQVGACASGSPKVCEAADQCHVAGICDPSTGECSSPASANGVACDDGNACTVGDTCSNGTCSAGSAAICTAQDACHVSGTCDSVTGTCSNPPEPDGVACDDASICNGRESCQSGTCVASSAPVLDDGNPCTADSCDPVVGVVHVVVSDGTNCESDGNVCNGTSACQAGACMQGVAPVLSDGNPCTADDCDPSVGVTHTPVAAGVSCGDADVCNGDERCDPSGHCAEGTPLSVDDGDACTLDDCDPATGVSHTEIPDCRPTAAVPGEPFETRASILGRVVRPDGSPVSAFSIQLFDNRLDGPARSDVLSEATPDGSFRARLTDFPESAQERSPPAKVILRVDGPEFPTLYRTVYLRPGDAATVGELVVLPRDSKVTVIGPEGGTAQDSNGAFEVQIPAGALSAPTPIRITPIPERRQFPTPLPTNTITMYGVELEPEGTTFLAPAKLRIRNSLNLPTTMAIPLGVVDTTYGDWRHEGFATWDGSRFSATITHFSTKDANGARQGELVAFNEGGMDPRKARGKDCINSSVGYTNGSLGESIQIPSYNAGGLNHAVTLNFNGGLGGSVKVGSPIGVPLPDGVGSPLTQSFASPKLRLECLAGGAGSGGGCGTGRPCTVGGGIILPTNLTRKLGVFGKDGALQTTLPSGAQGDGGFAHIELPTDEQGRPIRSGFQAVHFSAGLGLSSSCAVGGSAFGVASLGPAPLGGFVPGNATRVSGDQGPVSDFPTYELFVHRRGSPVGSGWAVEQASTVYRTPDRSSGDIIDGTGERETFRPYPQVKQLASAPSVTALATDTVTGQVFAASTSQGIQEVIVATGSLTPVAPAARFGNGDPLVLKVTRVGGERRFLAATRTGLFEINAAGVERLLYTFDTSVNSPRLPGVAGVGKFAYFTEDLRLTSVDAVVLRRIDLTTPSIAAEAISSAVNGDLRLDPHGETTASAFQFQHPRGLAPALDGGLYVADDRRHAVYHLAPDATGQVGSNSLVTRVLGSGVDTMLLGPGQSAPGLEMAVRAPGELSVAPNGTLVVSTANWSLGYASIITFDPVANKAQTMVFETTSFKQIAISTQGGSLAPLGTDSVLVPHSSAVFRVTTPLTSEFDPTRALNFTDEGATVIDSSADIVETYAWLNAAHTEAHLTSVRARSGELVYAISYLDDDRIDYLADANGGHTQFVYDGSGRLAEIRDPAGRSTRLTVDDAGDLREISFPDGEARRFTYQDHRLVSATHPNGETATYSYDADGTLFTATRPGGGVTTIRPAISNGPQYGSGGRLYYQAILTDERGVAHTYETNAAGDVVSDAYTADGVGYLVKNVYADKLVGTTEFENLSNRLLRFSSTTINGLLVSPITTWDPMGRPVRATQDASGAVNTEIGRLVFDAQGRLETQAFGSATALQFKFTYDTAGHLIKAADRNDGGETGRNTLFGGFRPSDAQPTTITSHGVTTTLGYDTSGRVTQASNTLGQSVSTTYDTAGNPTRVDDGITSVDLTYDAAGRVTSSKDAENNTTTFAYDDAGCACSNRSLLRQMATPDLAPGQAWRFGYDADNHLTNLEDPLGQTEQFAFNPQRELVAAVDRKGRSTTFTYDQIGRTGSITDRAGRVGLFRYSVPTAAGWSGPTLYAQSPNASSASTSLTATLADGQYQVGTNGFRAGANQNHIELYRDATFQLGYWNHYDARGRREWRADRSQLDFASTEPGPYSSSTVAQAPYAGERTPFSYQSSGPFAFPWFLEADRVGGYNSGQLARNANLDLTWYESFLRGTGSVFQRQDLLRDVAGRLIGTQTFATGNNPPSTSVTYKPNGLVDTLDGLAGKQVLGFDGRGLLSTRTLSFNYQNGSSVGVRNVGTFRYAYDKVGRNTSLVYPDGSGHTRTQTFDALGRLTSRCYRYVDGPERCYTASYDAANNPTTLTDPEMRRELSYDALDRITEVKRFVPNDATAPSASETYAYNALGGLAIHDGVALSDQRPRLDGAGNASAGIPAALAGSPVGLDNGGRVTSLSGTNFTYYRFDHRLQNFVTGATTETFAYDALLRTTEFLRNGVPVEIYLRDDLTDNIAAVSNGTAGLAGLRRRIIWDGVDHPLWMFDADRGVTVYFELDTTGNVRRLHAGERITGTGSFTGDLGGYSYTAFGRNIAATEPGGEATPKIDAVDYVQRLQWQGRWLYNRSGGLYDFRARFWSPQLGAFLQLDQYQFLSSGGTLWSWPGQNPFRLRDPSGRYGWEDFGNDFYKHSETALDVSLGVAALGLAGLAVTASGGTILFGLGEGSMLSGETILALRGLSGGVALFAGGKAAIDAALRGDGFGCGLALGGAISGAGAIGEGLGSGPRVGTGAPNNGPKLPRFDGPKPGYGVNPAHVPGGGLRPGKTPLPKDAAEVFKNAVPNDPANPTAWFGRNADGQIYRYSLTNDGSAHFSGINGVGDGTRNLTNYALERLGGL